MLLKEQADFEAMVVAMEIASRPWDGVHPQMFKSMNKQKLMGFEYTIAKN